jgi:hypothetical protein
VAINLHLVRKRSAVFDYGLVSKGQITLAGNATIAGVNTPDEASVLSTTDNVYDAICVEGSVVVTGDLSVSADQAYVSISGSPTIAGETDPELIAEHIHTGVEEPEFPQIDTAPLAALATNIVDANTDMHRSAFSNIRIVAGTNPVFAADITLNGVVYIEAPNIVKFEGKTTLNGLVVTQDADLPIESCQLRFTGKVEAFGVENLPDRPEFAVVRQQIGTFILAPGFGTTFAGNFTAINGTIAADQLTFTGSAEGVVNGSVIGLTDLPTYFGGNCEIMVDRSGVDVNPVGFVHPLALVPQPDTYAEVSGE